MRNASHAAALVAVLLLPACATITEGHSQKITFNSVPSGAQCTLTRKNENGANEVIGSVTTPGSIIVEKTKYDINVICTKAGYEDASNFIKSDVEGMTFGNLILGGGIGWAIDSATGSDNKYQEVNVVTLTPKPGATLTSAAPPAMPGQPVAAGGQVARAPMPDTCPGVTTAGAGAPPPTMISDSQSDPLPPVVEFRPPSIATRVCLDTGGYYEVRSISGTTVHTVDAARREADWVGLFFVPGNSTQQFDRAVAESIWPLKVGKSVSFNMSGNGANGSPGEWQETITVVRQEELTTATGQFRTVVVETREQSLTGPFQAVATRWYAPDVGFIVKYRREVEQGNGNAGAWTANMVVEPGL